MNMIETSNAENLSLQVSRVIKASRARVFAAWTEPELMLRWFAPGPMQPRTVDIDLREGGVFRAAMQGPSPRTGQEMCVTFTGTYERIVPDELLVFGWEVEGDPGDPTRVTVEFKDVDGGTEVVLTHERIPNQELVNRNTFGWTGMLEKLAGVCAE
jgi:uncharacterized protein YndB with AHSA1/START domain